MPDPLRDKLVEALRAMPVRPGTYETKADAILPVVHEYVREQVEAATGDLRAVINYSAVSDHFHQMLGERDAAVARADALAKALGNLADHCSLWEPNEPMAAPTVKVRELLLDAARAADRDGRDRDGKTDRQGDEQ